jgi:hypothetical protein
MPRYLPSNPYAIELMNAADDLDQASISATRRSLSQYRLVFSSWGLNYTSEHLHHLDSFVLVDEMEPIAYLRIPKSRAPLLGTPYGYVLFTIASPLHI